jgi:hypothetical protein
MIIIAILLFICSLVAANIMCLLWSAKPVLKPHTKFELEARPTMRPADR